MSNYARQFACCVLLSKIYSDLARKLNKLASEMQVDGGPYILKAFERFNTDAQDIKEKADLQLERKRQYTSASAQEDDDPAIVNFATNEFRQIISNVDNLIIAPLSQPPSLAE